MDCSIYTKVQTENVLAATPQAKADHLSRSSVTPLSEDDVLPIPPEECPVALLCSEDDHQAALQLRLYKVYWSRQYF